MVRDIVPRESEPWPSLGGTHKQNSNVANATESRVLVARLTVDEKWPERVGLKLRVDNILSPCKAEFEGRTARIEEKGGGKSS